jgi:peptide/nickel transport system substrate-binding protein
VLVEKPVVQTVVVEKEVLVEKPVVETVVVEKVVKETVEVVVTPAPGPKILNFAFPEPTMGLDPAIAGTATSKRIIQFLHDSLWEWDENMNPKPWMAESWDIADDHTVYTFHLRSDLKFSDGSPITAEDVKFSFERMAESELWKGRLSAIESIETPDPQTVVINMNRSVPQFMLQPAMHAHYFMVSKAAVEAGVDFNEPGTTVSGPYVLKEWVPKSHLVLVKNPYWWGVEAMGYPKFDEIFHRFHETSDAAVASLESSTADVFAPVSAKDVERLRKSPGVMLYEARRAVIRGFAMDKSRPPFSDVRVRCTLGGLRPSWRHDSTSTGSFSGSYLRFSNLE